MTELTFDYSPSPIVVDDGVEPPSPPLPPDVDEAKHAENGYDCVAVIDGVIAGEIVPDPLVNTPKEIVDSSVVALETILAENSAVTPQQTSDFEAAIARGKAFGG